MKPVPDFKTMIAAAVFLLAASTALSAADTAGFPFLKVITLPETAKDISAFTLDADVYRETARIPNGLRIVGPDNEFCPFIVCEEMRIDREMVVESDFPATVTGFETLPDGSVRISASLSNASITSSGDPRVVGLKILTAAKDFDKKVRIYAGNGETLLGEGAFLDYSSRVNLRNDTVRFSVPTRASDFVIVMDNYTEIKDSPFFRVVEGETNIVEQERFRESPKIDGIRLQVVRKQQSVHPVSASTPVEILSQVTNGKTTVVTFSNGFAPLNSLTVGSSDPFFSRPYRLRDEYGKLVASGTVRKLDTSSFHLSASDRTVEITAIRSKTWTLELDNGENAELKELSLQAAGPVYQIRFLSAIPAMSVDVLDALKGTLLPCYKLYYGGVDLPAPTGDFSDVLRSGDPLPSESMLSPQVDNPYFMEQSLTVRNWGLIYKIMMAAAAFAVVLILLVSVKKIDKIED